MKQGRTLQELANEVMRQSSAKKDYLAPTNMLDIIVEQTKESLNLDAIAAATEARQKEQPLRPANLRLGINGKGDFALKDLAYSQILEHCGIPKPYADRMRVSCPNLLKENMETWLSLKGDRRMIRTMDEHARAFLSDRFRPLDNMDLMLAVLNPLVEAGATVVSCEVTDAKLYIKATTDRITFEVKPGQVVQAGVLISNSEVGLARISVVPWTLVLWCTNGAAHESFGSRRTHLGGRNLGNGDTEIPEEWLRDETREADDKAIFMKLGDVVRSSFDEAKFSVIKDKMLEAAGRKIEADPVKVVEVAAKKYTMNEGEQGAMLRHLIEGGDLSQWGLGNAITRLSADVPSYDRASDLERFGGQVIEMPKQEWETLLTAASTPQKKAA